MVEEWRDIPGYEGLYQASNLGRVKSLARLRTGIQAGYKLPERILKQNVDRIGYKFCGLYKSGKVKTVRVHRLVALAFLPNPCDFPVINHKDENKTNNSVSNLEWCTQYYNCNYGSAIERRKAGYDKRGRKCVPNTNVAHDANKQYRLPKNDKAVYQMDMNGNILAVFPSVKEATRITGINNISAVARGILRQSRGYKWMYVKDVS